MSASEVFERPALPVASIRARRASASRPPKSARAAWQKWGLDSVEPAPVVVDDAAGPGHAGEAVRGELDVYTGEHYDADVRRRVIRGGRRKRRRDPTVPRPAVDCPVHHPDPNCKPGLVPRYYRSILRQAITVGAGEGGRPIRECRGKVICFDCRCWLAHQQRARFIAEHGEPGEDLGYVAQRYADHGDQRDEATAQAEAERQYAYVVSVAGEPAEDVDWDEIRRIAEAVEHCSRMFARAVARVGETTTAGGGSPEA